MSPLPSEHMDWLSSHFSLLSYFCLPEKRKTGAYLVWGTFYVFWSHQMCSVFQSYVNKVYKKVYQSALVLYMCFFHFKRLIAVSCSYFNWNYCIYSTALIWWILSAVNLQLTFRKRQRRLFLRYDNEIPFSSSPEHFEYFSTSYPQNV